ncbi:MAG TPA: alpha/beta fold hydrolase [Rhodopila sp.]|nr:alpha/beta fold hydrolase [Rhodopila sp.]
MRRLVLLLAILLPYVARAEERIDLRTRPNVIQPVYATFVARPVASLVLFPGSGGVYAMSRKNFLLRIAPDLVAQGFTVLVVDAPSDHASGMTWPFRASADHAADIGAVVELAKSRSPAPVWLVGTSMGSVSAANGAAVLGKRIGGVVLSSSVWAQGMAAIPLDRIVVPVLVVHNRDDGCQLSPFSAVNGAMARMTAAPVRQFLAVSGGNARSDACQALSPHGYWGIESQVVTPMVAWIRSH